MFGFLLSGSWLQKVLIALVTGMLVYWYIQKRKYKLPPGPMALPLIGNLLQMKTTLLHEQVYKDWSKKYGPVVSVYLGPMLIVFVNNIDMALEVLVKKSAVFASRISLTSMNILTMGGKDLAHGAYGPTWKLHKKIASKALRSYMQGKALEERVHVVMEEALLELDKQTESFDPSEYVKFIVGNLLTGLCFGEKKSFDNIKDDIMTRFCGDFNDILKSIIPEDIFPPIRYIYKSKAIRTIEDMVEKVYKGYLLEKLQEQKRTFDRNNIRHFADNLILARLEAEEENGSVVLESLTDTHLLQTIADIYFAGTETTGQTLKFAILHIMMLPDIQAKVQEEIDRVVGRDRLPCLSDRPNLSYTEAVLHESMRLSSVAPTGVMHFTTCDTELGQYQIPKGTIVAVNHWALHNDPEAWDQVNTFIPERYLDDDGKLGPKPKNWLPFSAGKRMCLGESVAKTELLLVFASLMQKFKWKPEPGVVPDVSPAGSMFVVFPKPYKVLLERRF